VAPRFAAAVASTFGTRLAVAALSFASILIVARALGAEGRGEVALLLTIASVSAQLARFGVEEANANLAGSEPGRRPALATNSVVLALAAGAAAVCLLVPLLAAFPALRAGLDWNVVFLALAVIPLLILQAYLTFIVRADYGFAVTNVAWLIGPLLTAVVNLVLAGLGELTVASAFGAWVAAHALATVLLAIYVARSLAGFGRPDLSLARRMLSFGFRAYVGRVLMVGNYRVDQWFVGGIAGTRELGLYSVAVAWAEMLFYLPTVLVLVQRPYLVRASREDAAARAVRVFRIGLLLTLPAAVGIVVAAPFLCSTIFGPEFGGAVDDLRVLALGAFGIVALQQLGNALTAQRRPGLATVAAAVAFVVTIALDVALVAPLGGLGAAIASTCAYVVGGLAVTFLFVREFRVPPAGMVPRARDVRHLGDELRRGRRTGATGPRT